MPEFEYHNDSFERLRIIESKEQLKQMAASGDYLFHGAPAQTVEFKPRQAYDAVDGVTVPDEEPAIFASSEVEVPIFRSIFHPSRYDGLEGQFSSGMSHGESVDPLFEVSKDALQAAQDKKGHVYVFERKDFELREGIEWRSNKVIKPVAVFNTSYKDIGFPVHVVG